jgi:prepilin peptidase CpaA
LGVLIWIPFGLFLVAAGASDIRSRRLPNWLMGLGALAGALACGLGAGWLGLLSAVLGALVGVLLLFAPFSLRAVGGGDVKLLGAIGAFLGPVGALFALLFGAVAGGFVAAAMLLPPLQRREGEKARKVPYGVALAAGGIAAALWLGFAGGILP